MTTFEAFLATLPHNVTDNPQPTAPMVFAAQAFLRESPEARFYDREGAEIEEQHLSVVSTEVETVRVWRLIQDAYLALVGPLSIEVCERENVDPESVLAVSRWLKARVAEHEGVKPNQEASSYEVALKAIGERAKAQRRRLLALRAIIGAHGLSDA